MHERGITQNIVYEVVQTIHVPNYILVIRKRINYPENIFEYVSLIIVI